MKRCPECRRDYYDDTLVYCLDDGSALLEGPASTNEPSSAILSETRVVESRFDRSLNGQVNTRKLIDLACVLANNLEKIEI